MAGNITQPEPTPQNDRVLLTLAEAAETLHISRSTLNGLTNAGAIHTVKIGRRGKRVPVAEVERFVREGGL